MHGKQELLAQYACLDILEKNHEEQLDKGKGLTN